ncbi:ferritin-like domain-containing protein [Ekhidna sp.]
MIHSSIFWKEHFKRNLALERVDWSIQPKISEEEKRSILYSLKAWQLGETSDGSHLLSAVSRYAKKIKDEEYISAVKLFIKEEQKHGRNLGRYINQIGEHRLGKDWGDTIFRKIRYFNKSMELWTITLIIVESAAQVFYQALKDATNCQLLKSICQDILIDEAHHIKFQNERLYQILENKNFYSKAVSIGFYGILFFGTIHAIWLGHRNAFKAGGIGKREFMRRMYYKFFNTLKFCHSNYSVPRNKELRQAY